jgi:hypothetical protein
MVSRAKSNGVANRAEGLGRNASRLSGRCALGNLPAPARERDRPQAPPRRYRGALEPLGNSRAGIGSAAPGAHAGRSGMPRAGTGPRMSYGAAYVALWRSCSASRLCPSCRAGRPFAALPGGATRKLWHSPDGGRGRPGAQAERLFAGPDRMPPWRTWGAQVLHRRARSPRPAVRNSRLSGFFVCRFPRAKR